MLAQPVAAPHCAHSACAYPTTKGLLLVASTHHSVCTHSCCRVHTTQFLQIHFSAELLLAPHLSMGSDEHWDRHKREPGECRVQLAPAQLCQSHRCSGQRTGPAMAPPHSTQPAGPPAVLAMGAAAGLGTHSSCEWGPWPCRTCSSPMGLLTPNLAGLRTPLLPRDSTGIDLGGPSALGWTPETTMAPGWAMGMWQHSEPKAGPPRPPAQGLLSATSTADQCQCPEDRVPGYRAGWLGPQFHLTSFHPASISKDPHPHPLLPHPIPLTSQDPPGPAVLPQLHSWEIRSQEAGGPTQLSPLTRTPQLWTPWPPGMGAEGAVGTQPPVGPI